MSMTAPLKNSTAMEVVKSAKLPATKAQRQYGDFDAFVANADKLVSFFGFVSRDEESLSNIEFEWVEWPETRPINLEEAKQQIQSAKWKLDSAQHWFTQFAQARKRLA